MVRHASVRGLLQARDRAVGAAPSGIDRDPSSQRGGAGRKRASEVPVSAPGEELAYVVAFDRAGQKHDAMTVVDVNAASDTYGQVVRWTDVPGLGDELHHFGWNACSSALKHEGRDMEGLARRYLLVPGLRSSNVYVLDIASDPRNPTLVKTIDAKTLSEKAGYSRPHTAVATGGRAASGAQPWQVLRRSRLGAGSSVDGRMSNLRISYRRASVASLALLLALLALSSSAVAGSDGSSLD